MNLDDFKTLLVQQTGLTLTSNDESKLRTFLQNRLIELNLTSLGDYLHLLTSNTLIADHEWQQVVQTLTVPESFFLRDKGQMDILQKHILPELIERNRHHRKLRLWSAGCATGEEPYSLAMLVQNLLPDERDWEVLILGTDINDKVLAKAKDAHYSRWSLRDVEPQVLNYFQPAAQGLLSLDAAIRQKVTFRRVNLLKTPFPDLEINNFDLILCRNVFIYFDQQAITTVLEKFTQTLKPEGYLLTGHGELYQQPLHGLQTHLFVESVVYQRMVRPFQKIAYTQPELPRIPSSRILPEIPIESVKPPKADPITEMTLAYQEGDYAGVLAIAQTLLSHEPIFEAHYWSAKAFASLGQYHTAESRLESALALDPRSASCFYLLALIKESQNDSDLAKSLLNKAIVLDEAFIPAYLDLAALYETDDPIKHQQLRLQAIGLLKKLPPEQYLDDFSSEAQELIQQLD